MAKTISSAPWRKHFNNYLQSWDCPTEIDPNSVEALQCALQGNFITNEQYLNWAKETYQIPVIDDKFFEMNQPNLRLWVKWHNKMNWKSSHIPIAEWENHLIIACLAPISDMNLDSKFIFVLTSNSNLSKWWTKYRPDEVTGIGILKTGTSTDLSNHQMIAKNTPSEGLSIPKFTIPEKLETSLQNDPFADMAALEKAYLKPAKAANDFEMNDLSPLDDDAGKPFDEEDSNDKQIDNEKLEGFEGLSSKTNKETDDNGFLSLELNLKPNVSLVKLDNFEISQPENEENKNIAPAPINAAKTNLANKIPTESVHLADRTKPEVIDKYDSSFFMDMIKVKNEKEIRSLAQKTFTQMQTHFTKALILSVNKQETIAKVAFTGLGCGDVKNQDIFFPLDQSSIFRIVTKTLKPYHGYIVINDINEKFIEAFLQGQIPDHITMTPIKTSEHFVGMLIGIGEKNAYTRNVLTQQETITQNFAKHLELIKKSTAA